MSRTLLQVPDRTIQDLEKLRNPDARCFSRACGRCKIHIDIGSKPADLRKYIGNHIVQLGSSSIDNCDNGLRGLGVGLHISPLSVQVKGSIEVEEEQWRGQGRQYQTRHWTSGMMKGYCWFVTRPGLMLSPIPLVLSDLCYLGLDLLDRLSVIEVLRRLASLEHLLLVNLEFLLRHTHQIT